MLDYPLEVGFKIATIGTRVRVADATGSQVAYVRKKKFKLKEDITVFENEDQENTLLRINANRVLDFSASYAISSPNGRHVGAVGRRGMRSLWRSSYGLTDAGGEEVGSIHEENPWTKVFDSLVEALPLADMLDGLFFNPAYLIDLRGQTVLRMQKQRSFFESNFRLEKLAGFSEEEEDLLLGSIIMMVILERERG